MGGKRVTKSDWIRRCREHHGDKFDYSISEFRGMRGSIEITCPIHGQVTVSTETHARGGDCRLCVDAPEPGSSLADCFPESILEWHERNRYSAEHFGPNSHRKVWWRCSACRHEFEARIGDRTQKRTPGDELAKCPACRGRDVHIDGRNSLHSQFPQLSAEFDLEANAPHTPRGLATGSRQRVTWRCSMCSHTWLQRVAVRTRQGTGCPACSNHELHVDGRNSLQQVHHLAATMFHPTKNSPLTVHTVVGAGGKRYWWLHKECGNEFSAVLSAVIRSLDSGSSACGYCSKGYLHSDGRNSLSIEFPDLAREWHPVRNGSILPSNVPSGSGRRRWWKCSECGHEWRAQPYKRTVEGQNCARCAPGGEGVRPDGLNSLLHNFPELSREWHPTRNALRPSDVRPGSSFDAYWCCTECDWVWRQKVNVRTGQGVGCPKCCNIGFKPHELAYLYSFSFSGVSGIEFFKGGISDNPERRLQQIRKSLFDIAYPLDVEIVDCVAFDEGWVAQELETRLLRCKEIRHTSIEKFDGSNELFTVGPIRFAKKSGWINT